VDRSDKMISLIVIVGTLYLVVGVCVAIFMSLGVLTTGAPMFSDLRTPSPVLARTPDLDCCSTPAARV
jgi:hypothetical protein